MKQAKTLAIAACLLIGVSVNAQQKAQAKRSAHTTHTATKKVAPASLPQQSAPVEDLNADFLKSNSTVKSVKWEKGSILILEKTDGTTERYNVDKYQDEQEVRRLYGKVPPFPPLPASTTAPTSWKPGK